MNAVNGRTNAAWNTNTMVKISVLSVIAFLLMFFEIPLVFIAPPFLQIDISDLPAVLGAFAMGPMAGVIIELLKNILNVAIEGSSTAMVGEFSNFVLGSVFVGIAGALYQRKKTFKNAVLGLVLGTIAMTVIMAFVNYYVMFPFYSKLFGLPLEEIIKMGTAINAGIVDLKTMMVYAVVPFNLIKGVLISALSILIYKRVSPILHR